MDPSQVEKAAAALLKHIQLAKKKKKELIESNDVISLIVGLRNFPQKKRKAYRIYIPHSLYAEDSEICLITKDPQREYKDKLDKECPGLDSPVKKVIGISKLRDKYKPHEAKRNLCSTYDLFLADERIIPLLPQLLGKAFFNKKKQPVPVDISKGSILPQIKKARDSTFLHLGAGPCSAVKVARTEFTVKQVVENIMTAVEGILAQVPKKWKGIQSLHIKTHDSVALPIYAYLPEPTKIASEKTDE
eukprot:TRINITY_DN1253_c0_g1::TRINITY_DN1253_c0_g1_i1::g.26936::m.26936 TRINITY_DN1253_c0_g1::TRINITY_DN1253_c0_g1_i1::g.26936  ORF type:complete len:261 (+),score=33.80,sp/Q5RCE6/RL1D1_PONAB/33.59/1e-39,Ribosomal_L1/PF00687.16/8.6e-56,DUF1390/PF07150.6/0.17,Peptidase_M17_N/PF02789.12/8.7,Peptidase_M17_N/PF02789.12/45 TRINITY_DN1253_c0_g1_i1:46-783(+)